MEQKEESKLGGISPVLSDNKKNCGTGIDQPVSPNDSPFHKMRSTFKAEPFLADDKNFDIDLKKINHKQILPKLHIKTTNIKPVKMDCKQPPMNQRANSLKEGSIINPHARYQQYFQ